MVCRTKVTNWYAELSVVELSFLFFLKFRLSTVPFKFVVFNKSEPSDPSPRTLSCSCSCICCARPSVSSFKLAHLHFLLFEQQRELQKQQGSQPTVMNNLRTNSILQQLKRNFWKIAGALFHWTFYTTVTKTIKTIVVQFRPMSLSCLFLCILRSVLSLIVRADNYSSARGRAKWHDAEFPELSVCVSWILLWLSVVILRFFEN